MHRLLRSAERPKSAERPACGNLPWGPTVFPSEWLMVPDTGASSYSPRPATCKAHKNVPQMLRNPTAMPKPTTSARQKYPPPPPLTRRSPLALAKPRQSGSSTLAPSKAPGPAGMAPQKAVAQRLCTNETEMGLLRHGRRGLISKRLWEMKTSSILLVLS